MNLLRRSLAWMLYGLGHAVWWCLDRDWCGGMGGLIYPIYNRLMTLSVAAQGSGAVGPWERITQPPGASHDG